MRSCAARPSSPTSEPATSGGPSAPRSARRSPRRRKRRRGPGRSSGWRRSRAPSCTVTRCPSTPTREPVRTRSASRSGSPAASSSRFPLQLSGAARSAQGRTGAGRGQRGRAQAGKDDAAADGTGARRLFRRRRAAGGRPVRPHRFGRRAGDMLVTDPRVRRSRSQVRRRSANASPGWPASRSCRWSWAPPAR